MPKHPASVAPTEDQHPASLEDDDVHAHWQRVVGRRSFLKGVGLVGAAALPGSALFTSEAMARSSRITGGDIAILRFLAAAELIESDLWTQYNELGGVNGGNPAYMAALENLDGDMPQYISDNTDVGASFPQAITIRNQPAIALTDADTPPTLNAPVPPVGPQENRLQAIANTAGFHFAFIEQGGASLARVDVELAQVRQSPDPLPQHAQHEISHARFLNAYLRSQGARPVNLLQHDGTQGLEPGGAANRGEHRRSGDQPLLRSGTTRRAMPWLSHWPVSSTPRRTCRSPTSTPTVVRRLRPT